MIANKEYNYLMYTRLRVAQIIISCKLQIINSYIHSVLVALLLTFRGWGLATISARQQTISGSLWWRFLVERARRYPPWLGHGSNSHPSSPWSLSRTAVSNLVVVFEQIDGFRDTEYYSFVIDYDVIVTETRCFIRLFFYFSVGYHANWNDCFMGIG